MLIRVPDRSVASDDPTGVATATLRSAFVSSYDARDVAAFNSRGYFVPRALERQGVRLDHIGPLPCSNAVRVKQLVYRRVLRREFAYHRDVTLLKHYARIIERHLRSSDAEVVLSNISPGSQPIAYVECDQPIAMWTDTTFSSMLESFPPHELAAPGHNIRGGRANERATMERCSRIIFYCDWSAQKAIEHYGLDPQKVKVVLPGAALESTRTFDDVEPLVAARPRDRCKLLFIGSDWKRKGGDVALQVAARLNERGLPTSLKIIGSTPPPGTALPDHVEVLGFVSKASVGGLATIENALAEAHFLILPTRGDLTPLVVPEANSFGVPALATSVYGLPSMVRHGESGLLFDVDSDLDAWADAVLDVLHAPRRYGEMARAAFHEYAMRLNWDSAARAVKQILIEMRDEASGRPCQRS